MIDLQARLFRMNQKSMATSPCLINLWTPLHDPLFCDWPIFTVYNSTQEINILFQATEKEDIYSEMLSWVITSESLTGAEGILVSQIFCL